MNNLISMIDSLRTGKTGAAESAFKAAMAEKINSALDAQKVVVASQIYNQTTQAEK